MQLQNEFRHILKGNDAVIDRGRQMVKSLELPTGIEFSDALLYQLGAGEKDMEYMKEKAKEFLAFL
jgi:hypothetical protein